MSCNVMLCITNLVFEPPRVSSRSSCPHTSWILSPSHGFTLPNANSSETTSAIGISALLSNPRGIAGEQVPLCPGVHIRDPPWPKPVSLNPNGFAATRLNVGDAGPLCGTRTPENQERVGAPQGELVLIRGGDWAVGELTGGVTGALMEPLWM